MGQCEWYRALFHDIGTLCPLLSMGHYLLGTNELQHCCKFTEDLHCIGA